MDDLSGFVSPCRALGRPTVALASCASTNDEARALAARGAPHGALVVADTQTAGRGRRGRAWSSPPGCNLYASFVLRPRVALHDAPTLALVAGLAVADAVAAHCPDAPVRVKWPNDVRCRGLKLAGVLVEGALRGAELAYVVLGVGVNVRGEAAPEGLEDVATTMRALRGADLSRADVLASLCAALEARLDVFESRGFEGLREELAARCETLGARVTTDVATGLAVALDRDGALLVRTDAGAVVPVRVGDVT